MVNYDMCVDQETLYAIEDKLGKIEHDLNNSTRKMITAIQRSQEFLAGHQFEKAKNTTMRCTEITARAESNVRLAKEYIGKLISVLEEYSKCGYDEEA